MTGMKPVKILLLSSALIIPMLARASLSFSDVRVDLRNGRSITADDCRESGTSLLCSKMGGTFEIDKRDIVRISTVKGEGSDDNGAVTPETGSAEGGTAETGNAEKTSQDGSGSRRKAAAKRLEEIRQRKSELKNEREKLSREREQLQSDIKNAPDWMPVKQYDEINRKNSDIERRIKSFNEEVRGLDAEEKGIQDELKAGRTGVRAAPSDHGSAITPEPAGVPATE
jgi:hypothetical protein